MNARIYHILLALSLFLTFGCGGPQDSRRANDQDPEDHKTEEDPKPDSGNSGSGKTEGDGEEDGNPFKDENLTSNGTGGITTGNGGDGLYCIDKKTKKPYVLTNDFYEAEYRWHMPMKIEKGKTLQERVLNTLMRLKASDPERYAILQGLAKNYFEEGVVRYWEGVHVLGSLDADMLVTPRNCQPVRIARQSEPEIKRDAYYNINLDYFNLMDEPNKASLVLHEIIYRHFKEYGHSTSTKSRYFNTLISSNNLLSMNPESYLKTLAELAVDFSMGFGLVLDRFNFSSIDQRFDAVPSKKSKPLIVSIKFMNQTDEREGSKKVTSNLLSFDLDKQNPGEFHFDRANGLSAINFAGYGVAAQSGDSQSNLFSRLSIDDGLFPTNQRGKGKLYLDNDFHMRKVELMNLDTRSTSFSDKIPHLNYYPLSNSDPRKVEILKSTRDLHFTFPEAFGKPRIGGPSPVRRVALKDDTAIFFNGQERLYPFALLRIGSSDLFRMNDGKLRADFSRKDVFFNAAGSVQLFPDRSRSFWERNHLVNKEDYVKDWKVHGSFFENIRDPQKVLRTFVLAKDIDFNLIESVTASFGSQNLPAGNFEFDPIQVKNTFQIDAALADMLRPNVLEFKLLNGSLIFDNPEIEQDGEFYEINSKLGEMIRTKIIIDCDFFKNNGSVNLSLSYTEKGEGYVLRQSGGWVRARADGDEDIEIEWEHLVHKEYGDFEIELTSIGRPDETIVAPVASDKLRKSVSEPTAVVRFEESKQKNDRASADTTEVPLGSVVGGTTSTSTEKPTVGAAIDGESE